MSHMLHHKRGASDITCHGRDYVGVDQGDTKKRP